MPTPVQSQFRERPYFPEDFRTLDKIERQAGNARWNRLQLNYYTNHLGMDTRVITSVDQGNRPIGFFVLEHGDKTIYLCNIAVAEEWRRRGAASFALGAAENLARDLGYREIALDVQEENLAAQLLYRKAGYRAVNIRRKHYADQDGYRMVKDLS